MKGKRQKKCSCKLLGRISGGLPTALLVGLVVAVASGVYACPMKTLFHIDCPGCGMTRAMLALLRFDMKAAFELHCLFPLPIFWASYYLIHSKIRFSRQAEEIFLLVSAALFMIRWGFILIFT